VKNTLIKPLNRRSKPLWFEGWKKLNHCLKVEYLVRLSRVRLLRIKGSFVVQWSYHLVLFFQQNAGEQIAASVTKRKRKRIWKSLGHWAKEWSRNAKNAEATQPYEKRWHQYSESLVLASWSFPGISEKVWGWDRGCFVSSNFSDWVITLGALCVLLVSWKLEKWCPK